MNLQKPTQKHRDLIYDVGLNLGQDTDFYLKKGFRVIAFEADPDNVATCKKRFADAIESGQLIIVEGAIVENKSTVKQETSDFTATKIIRCGAALVKIGRIAMR